MSTAYLAASSSTSSSTMTSPSSSIMSLPDFLLPPPLYSLSTAAPSYSSEPGPSEQRLAITSRVRARAACQGILRRSHGGIVVALHDQDEETDTPIYTRGGAVAGDIGLASTQSISSVSVTLEGRLEVAIGERAESEPAFLSISHTLWKADGASTCPSVLPFELAFPTTYTDRVDERARPLPPSFDPHAESSTVKNLVARVEYRLLIRVTKSKLGKMLWKPQKTLTVPIKYAPRSRPYMPILAAPFPFLAGTLKSATEEWAQICATVSAKAPALSDIDCHLFIPAVQIYAIADVIPFFLQLRAPAASLLALLRPAAASSTSLRRLRSNTPADSAPALRVFIRRQVVVHACGQRLARSYIAGEGVLRPVPPGSPSPAHDSGAQDDETVNYEGEISCEPLVTVGGFTTARLSVTDYMMLSIIPAGASADSFTKLSKAHPIRLVTESYRSD